MQAPEETDIAMYIGQLPNKALMKDDADDVLIADMVDVLWHKCYSFAVKMVYSQKGLTVTKWE